MKKDPKYMTIGEVWEAINNGETLADDLYWVIRNLYFAYEKKNEDLFMVLVYGAYLNRNRLPVTKAYEIACVAARNRHIIPMTLTQVRTRLAKLDPDAVALARDEVTR